MSNPVFNRMRDQRGYATFGPPQQRGQGTATAAPMSAGDLQTMYEAPSATSVDTGRMTYDDVIVKTGLTFVAVLVGGVVGWQVPALALPGALIGFVLAMVNSFKRSPSPALVLLYGLFEGLFLGAVSGIFEARYPGIVVQAVIGTLGVFAVVLVAFRSGKLRATPRLTKVFMISLVGYVVFGLVNFGIVVFTGHDLRSGVLGIVIGLFAITLASYSLVLDFEYVKAGVDQGVPAKMAWYGAFALTVTLVWLYVEILRLISIFRNN